MKATKSSWFMEWSKYCDLIHYIVIVYKMHYSFVNNVSVLLLQEQNGPKTTCVLQDVTPGTYAIEVWALLISYVINWVLFNNLTTNLRCYSCSFEMTTTRPENRRSTTWAKVKRLRRVIFSECLASVFALIRCCLCLLQCILRGPDRSAPWPSPSRWSSCLPSPLSSPSCVARSSKVRVRHYFVWYL